MRIALILKTIWRNVGIFLSGAILGLIINLVLIFPRAVQEIAAQQDIGLGIIAVAPALFIIYGVISIVIGGFGAVVIYNLVRFFKGRKAKNEAKLRLK